MLARAVTLRCPACGARGMVQRWLRVGPACPTCRQSVDRPEPGYYLGALMVNLVLAELLLATAVLTVVLMSWPAVPWTTVLYGGATMMLLAPVASYPVTKLIWLAIDLRLQPELGTDTRERVG